MPFRRVAFNDLTLKLSGGHVTVESPSGNFTSRELEILELQKDGYQDKEIARILKISLNTVKNTLGHMREREERTTTDLVVRAESDGLLSPDFINGINEFRSGKWRR